MCSRDVSNSAFSSAVKEIWYNYTVNRKCCTKIFTCADITGDTAEVKLYELSAGSIIPHSTGAGTVTLQATCECVMYQLNFSLGSNFNKFKY